MALFVFNNKSLVKVRARQIGLEKELQSLFERNLDTLLNIQFLASEYTTSFGGRIDSL